MEEVVFCVVVHIVHISVHKIRNNFPKKNPKVMIREGEL